MQDYLGCIAAVDESIGKILGYLEDSGLASNTLVVYTSDQGFYLGEHGWFDKRFMYEESLRMPLLVCYPDFVPPASVNQDMVSNLDFAPTFLDLAGVKIPPEIQGRSFKNILMGREIKDWRESFYYHYYEYPAVHMVKRHYGVRTKRYKLMHFYYDIDAWELYDLEKDPLEMNNVYGDPAYHEITQDLQKELLRLRAFYKDSEELDKKFIEIDLKARE
jgi:arylsulfatase A-like enzyme